MDSQQDTQSQKDVQDEDYGIPIEHLVETNTVFSRKTEIEIQLGDKSHLEAFAGLNLSPGEIPYMKNALWRRGEEALKAYKPLYKIIKFKNQTLNKYKDFANFCEKSGAQIDYFTKKTAEAPEPTHVTMCGSKFHIKPEDEEEFLKLYAVLVSTGCKLFFVERPTEVYRYFCDFDFKQLAPIPDQFVEAVAIVVQRVLRKFYPIALDEDVLRSIVCTTDCKKVKATSTVPELVKTGVHILWPNLFVSIHMSLDIRESILVEMQETFGIRMEPSNDWEDVVDVSVYPGMNKQGSGLRMVGSCKSQSCTSCKGSKKIDPKDKNSPNCVKCQGIGKLDEGRPYFPLMVLKTSGVRDVEAELEYMDNIHKLILDTKIRTPASTAPTDGYLLPEGAPKYVRNEPGRQRRQGGNDVMVGGKRVPSVTGSLFAGTKFTLSMADPVWETIQDAIRAHPCKMYSDIIVNQITTNAKRSKYVVHVTGKFCRFCQNKGDEHNSNRIFFEFESNGFVQKCHDDGTDVLIHGICSSYKSATQPITAIQTLLFPETKNLMLAANDACRKADEEELDYPDSDDRPLTNKMRTLLLAGDFLSSYLFSEGDNACLWSRTLRNNGKRVVNVGSMRTDLMDTYIEVDPLALGARKNALDALGFKMNLPILAEEPSEHKQCRKTQSLTFLRKQIFKELMVLIDKVSQLDQSKLKNFNVRENEYTEEGDLRLREYDVDAFLNL